MKEEELIEEKVTDPIVEEPAAIAEPEVNLPVEPSEVIVKEPVPDPLLTEPVEVVPYVAPEPSGTIATYLRGFTGDPPEGFVAFEYVSTVIVFLLLFRVIVDVFRGWASIFGSRKL